MHFRRKRLPVLLGLTLLMSGTLPAAQAFEVRDAVSQTLKNNAEVRMKWHNFRASTEEKGVAQAGFLPSIDFSVAAARESRDSPAANGGRNSSSFTRNGYNLSLSQNLFQGFITTHQVKQLDLTSRARYYEYLAEAENQSLEAVRAYIDVVRFGKLVEIAEENYAVHKGIYEQILQRVSQGVGRRVDLEQVAGRMALAESNLLNEIANLHDVSARYARIVGNAAPEQLTLAGLLASPSGDEVMNLAEKNNPRLQAAAALFHSAESEISARKGAFMPTLDLRASRDSTNNRDGVKGRDNRSALELVFNMNLYRGGADKARLSAAAARLDEAEALGTKACRDMRQQVAIAYNDSLKLDAQLDALRQHQLSTEKARDAYRQQFDIGQRTLLDMLDSENELFTARRDLLIAELDLQLARYRIAGESGRLLEVLQLKQAEPEGLNSDALRTFACATAKADPSIALKPAKSVMSSFTTSTVAPTVVSKTVPTPLQREVVINTRVQFDLSSANIREESKAELNSLAQTLLLPEMAGKRYLVEGHTDSSGNAAANLSLSQQRADAVKQYLITQGVPADRLDSLGRGNTAPLPGIAANDPSHRRVLIVTQSASALPASPTAPAAAPVVQRNAPVSAPVNTTSLWQPAAKPAANSKPLPAPLPYKPATPAPQLKPAPAAAPANLWQPAATPAAVAANPAPVQAAPAPVLAPLGNTAVPATSSKAQELRSKLLRMAPGGEPSSTLSN